MQHSLAAMSISKTIGKKRVLQPLSLELSGGMVYGFVGENGSGKTMLFRILCGLVRPTEGSVFLDDVDVHKGIGGLRIGALLENPSLWPELTGRENLLCLSRIRKEISGEEVDGAMLRMGLDPENPLPFRKYSLGMRQRLLIVQAVMEAPDFLFLDEPTNSLDEDGKELVYRIIMEEADRGALVCVTSHIKQDISTLCDKVFYMASSCPAARRERKSAIHKTSR